MRNNGLMVMLTLSGCAVGPNFTSPTPPVTSTYTDEVLTGRPDTAGAAPNGSQRLRFGTDLPGEWWTLFGSSKLEVLLREAMQKYPEIAAQQAALRAAQENVRAQAGVFFPQVQAMGNATREKISGASLGPGSPGFITNIVQANVDVSYSFDMFGGERRAAEGLRAEAGARNFMLEAGYLTLTSNVVSTVVQLAAVGDQIAATREIESLEQKQLTIVERQAQLGSRTRADVLQLEANLATVRATLPALDQQRAVAGHQLAVLTGHFPGDAARPAFTLSDLNLPQDLPVSLPASLAAQRPDIRAQEMSLRQASAAIGIATANMLPQVTLTGAYGGEAWHVADLAAPGFGVWSFAAGIAQPLFQGGTLRAERRAAIDEFDQANAQYRLVVLQAFQNVADVLTALDNDARSLEAEEAARNAAKASLDLVRKQYDFGAADTVSLLTSQQIYQQACLGYIRASATRYIDTVALFQALGGGWWNRQDEGTLPATASKVRNGL
jgi:NodT family efflux transporter outer membrane factor (OMF) lipoprotein